MKVLATEKGVESHYELSNPIDFFESVNDWLNVEGEKEAFVRLVDRGDGTKFLVDGCDDSKKILAIDTEVVLFHNEGEAFSVIKEFVDKADLVGFLENGTIH